MSAQHLPRMMRQGADKYVESISLARSVRRGHPSDRAKSDGVHAFKDANGQTVVEIDAPEGIEILR